MLPSALGRKNKAQAAHLTEDVEGCQGAGEDILETLQPFPLLLLAGAGEDESPLRCDDGEAGFPAVPSDALGQVFRHSVPLLLAPKKNLALFKGILKVEDTWSSEATPGANRHLQPGHPPKLHFRKRCLMCVVRVSAGDLCLVGPRV